MLSRVAVTLLGVAASLCLVGCTAPAGRYPRSWHDPQTEAELTHAIARLQDWGLHTGAELKAIERKAEIWRQRVYAWGSAQDEFAEVTDAVNAAAGERRIESDVTISTYPGDKATVKYQTYGQRLRGEPSMTAKELTTCTERMVIGWYYIWSERHGRVTSDDEHYYAILNPEECVELREYHD
ncbi:MAG: hypothetical protein JSU70_07660 [Phycisphaerales bacterium]|nr:MAG: hypothetical protein JSU70_07660 [Phycisphaerales bacterium]